VTVACRPVLAVFVLEEDLDHGLVPAGEGSSTENGHAVDQGGPSCGVGTTIRGLDTADCHTLDGAQPRVVPKYAGKGTWRRAEGCMSR